jgi:hypothetical protein
VTFGTRILHVPGIGRKDVLEARFEPVCNRQQRLVFSVGGVSSQTTTGGARRCAHLLQAHALFNHDSHIRSPS